VSVGGFLSFDLCSILSSQPLQIMAKDMDSGQYAYCLLIWHERLLYPEEERAERARQRNERRARSRAAAAGAAAAAGGALRRLWG
jgi:hypothetical protein